MKSNNVVNIEDYARRRALQPQDMQAIANKRHKDAADKRHRDAEIIRRWQLRQSIETIGRRMNIRPLYVQAVLRENFVAILPPIETKLIAQKAA